jgi:hypothetical protein
MENFVTSALRFEHEDEGGVASDVDPGERIHEKDKSERHGWWVA